MSRLTKFLALGVVALTAACSRGNEPTSTPTPRPTPRATAAADSRQVVTADGSLALSVPPQTLSFPAGGLVLELPVAPGDEVRSGDLLARIDPLPLERAAAEARAALATARDQVARLEAGSPGETDAARAESAAAAAALGAVEAQVELARLRGELDRARNSLWGLQADRDSICGAVERGFAEQARCDGAQAAVQGAEDGVRIAERAVAAAEASYDDDLAAARARASAANSRLRAAITGASAEERAAAAARLEQAEGALAQAEADLERAELRAPFAGEIDQVHTTTGVPVSPGSPVVTLVKTRPLLFATTNLSERNVGLVRAGQTAEVTLSAFPARQIPATVERVGARAETSEGAPVFTVYLTIRRADDLPLRPGMTGRVEIEVGSSSRDSE
jgi:HlyD family secretion protein